VAKRDFKLRGYGFRLENLKNNISNECKELLINHLKQRGKLLTISYLYLIRRELLKNNYLKRVQKNIHKQLDIFTSDTKDS
jgi:hypothetical protein